MDTHKWVLTMAVTVSICYPAAAGIIFSQDFSSRPDGPVSSYIGSPPNAGQWDTINWTGTRMTGGISNGVLSFTRDGLGAGWFARITDLSPTPPAIIYSFDLEVTGNTIATPTAATWAVGSGFATASGTEPVTSVHSRFAIDLTSTPGTYKLRNLVTGISRDIRGLKTITWVINNSGAALNYLAPDNIQYTLPNDSWDLWTDTTRIFNGVGATSGGRSLTDLKFDYENGYGTIKMDNFSIRTIPAVPVVPEPRATGVLAAAFVAVIALAGSVRSNRSNRGTQR